MSLSARRAASALTLETLRLIDPHVETAEEKKEKDEFCDNDCRQIVRCVEREVLRGRTETRFKDCESAAEYDKLSEDEQKKERDLGFAYGIYTRTPLGLASDTGLLLHALKEQLRKYPDARLDLVEFPLAEAVKYSKAAGQPETISATKMRFLMSPWTQLFGVPLADTYVPVLVAGLICYILQTGAEKSPLEQFSVPLLRFIELQATTVLADPAFSTLREFFMNQTYRIQDFELGFIDFSALITKSKAFWRFGNPVISKRLMLQGWPAIISRLAALGVAPSDVNDVTSNLLQGLFTFMERRDSGMFRFAVFAVHVSNMRITQLPLPKVTRASLSDGFLLFSTAANIFFNSNMDKQYLRGVWSLGANDWHDWSTSFASAVDSGYKNENLVRVGRTYVLNNMLEASFAYEANASGEPRYEAQTKNPTMGEFLERVNKSATYT